MKDKVSALVGFRIMQTVYSPLYKFHNDMKLMGYPDYVLMVNRYFHDAIIHCKSCDIEYFKTANFSFTINNVSKDIVKLYDKYYVKYHDTLFVALEHVFNCLVRDCNK